MRFTDYVGGWSAPATATLATTNGMETRLESKFTQVICKFKIQLFSVGVKGRARPFAM